MIVKSLLTLFLISVVLTSCVQVYITEREKTTHSEQDLQRPTVDLPVNKEITDVSNECRVFILPIAGRIPEDPDLTNLEDMYSNQIQILMFEYIDSLRQYIQSEKNKIEEAYYDYINKCFS